MHVNVIVNPKSNKFKYETNVPLSLMQFFLTWDQGKHQIHPLLWKAFPNFHPKQAEVTAW